MVLVAAVPIVLFVCLIVLAIVADDIAQGEAVMGRDEVDARPAASPFVVENIARAGDPQRELADEAVIPFPEPAHRVAIAVVPFSPIGRKIAKPIAARPDIPGLGDEFHL